MHGGKSPRLLDEINKSGRGRYPVAMEGDLDPVSRFLYREDMKEVNGDWLQLIKHMAPHTLVREADVPSINWMNWSTTDRPLRALAEGNAIGSLHASRVAHIVGLGFSCGRAEEPRPC